MNSNTRNYVAVLFVTVGLMSGMLFMSANSQPSSNNSGASNQSNTSSQGIGSAEELSQALGNNSEMLTNKTSIGNSNASLGEKMSVESNTTGNQTNSELK